MQQNKTFFRLKNTLKDTLKNVNSDVDHKTTCIALGNTSSSYLTQFVN